LCAWLSGYSAQVLRVLRTCAAKARDEVGIITNLRLAPALPVIPEELQGKPIVALVGTYAGAAKDGEEALRPIRQELGTPDVDTLAPKPYVTHQKMFDPALPHGRHYYWKSHKLG